MTVLALGCMDALFPFPFLLSFRKFKIEQRGRTLLKINRFIDDINSRYSIFKKSQITCHCNERTFPSPEIYFSLLETQVTLNLVGLLSRLLLFLF